MKATDVIRRDHRAAEALFDKFNSAAPEDRREIEKEIFKALASHELMEDKHFYSALALKAPGDEVVQQMAAHQVSLEASTMSARAIEAVSGVHDERMEKVMENVLAHAKEEEEKLLPKAEELFTDVELEELGEKMEPDSAVAQSKE